MSEDYRLIREYNEKIDKGYGWLHEYHKRLENRHSFLDEPRKPVEKKKQSVKETVFDSDVTPVRSVIPLPIPESASIVLGDVTNEKYNLTGDEVRVDQKGLYEGSLMVGAPGSGKSSELVNAICQQAALGDSLLVFDPHGDLCIDVIRRVSPGRVKDIYFLDLTKKQTPFGCNIFAGAIGLNENAKDEIKNLVEQAFTDLSPSVAGGMYFEDIMRNIIGVMVENEKMLLRHVPKFLIDEPFRLECLEEVKDRDIRDFWLDEYGRWSASKQEKHSEPFLNRIKKLLGDKYISGVVNQPGRCINFREAIIKRRIILIKLPINELATEKASEIVGTFLMAMVYFAVFSFGNLDKEKRPGVTVVVDEFYNFILSGERFEKLLRQGRKFGVKLLLAGQDLDQLDKERLKGVRSAVLKANVLMSFSVSEKSAKELGGSFPGLRRRPTNFYLDPIDRMDGPDTHDDIKDFYRHWIARLLNAPGRMVKADGVEILPVYDFGFGDVSFNPFEKDKLISRLKNFFYDAQINEAVSEERKQELLIDWCRLSGGVRMVKERVADDSIHRALAAEKEGFDRLLSEKRREEAGLDDTLRRKMRDVENEVRDEVNRINAELETERQKLQVAERAWNIEKGKKIENADLVGGSVRFRFGQDGLFSSTKYMTYELYITSSWGRTRQVKRDCIEYAAKFGKSAKREIEASWIIWERWKSLYEDLCDRREKVKSLEEMRNDVVDKGKKLVSDCKNGMDIKKNIYAEKVSSCKEKVMDLEVKSLIDVEKVDSRFEAAFNKCLAALIAYPLASDSDVSIADVIQGFNKRYAVVKVGNVSQFMKTVDMDGVHPDFAQRIKEIEKRTFDEYCMNREDVERAIEAVFSSDGGVNAPLTNRAAPGRPGGDSVGAGGAGRKRGKGKREVAGTGESGSDADFEEWGAL